MIRKDLIGTQVYLILLTFFTFISGLSFTIIVSAYSVDKSFIETITPIFLIWIIFASIPLIWALILYKIPKKFNIISIIFPLLTLTYICRQLAGDFARRGLILDLIYSVLLLYILPLILAFLGIFFILNETYSFKNKKKSWALIILGVVFFIVIMSVYYFNHYGGNVDNIYLTHQDYLNKKEFKEIDPLRTNSSKMFSKSNIVYNSSGIFAKDIAEIHDAGCSNYDSYKESFIYKNLTTELCCLDYGVRPDFRICKSTDGKYQNLWFVSNNNTYILDSELVMKEGLACFYKTSTKISYCLKRD